MHLKYCAMTEVPHKTPASPYISRGLLPLESAMPGRAVAPQMHAGQAEAASSLMHMLFLTRPMIVKIRKERICKVK